MAKRNAFTLVELLVVVMIAGILAAIAIPIMRAQIDAAKWTEGKAVAGSIASALRVYCVQMEEGGPYGLDVPDLVTLGIAEEDLKGAYFARTDFSWETDYDGVNDAPIFTITIYKPLGIAKPDQITLNQSGKWTEINN